jgi:hypothetical protein
VHGERVELTPATHPCGWGTQVGYLGNKPRQARTTAAHNEYVFVAECQEHGASD